MRMKKAFKAMLAATACACVLTMPLSIHAAEPTDGLVVDGSLLTHDDSAEVTELFEWRFENSESEVAPLGTYYAKGHAGISKVSSKSVYITATTDCYEKVAKELQSAGVKRVVEMKPGSSLYDEKDFWQFKIHCYGTDEGCFLVMFAGDKGIDWKTMDCLMSVRIFDKAKCGNPQIDMENLVCCARCGLYNDFDVCKGHNQNTGKGYTAGAMLLGNISLKKYSEAIKRDFSEVRDQIRYISITGNMKQADGELSTWIGESRTELNHYYILPSGCADTGDFITKILSESGRNRVYLTGEKCGVCGSGFFISRKLD